MIQLRRLHELFPGLLGVGSSGWRCGSNPERSWECSTTTAFISCS